MDRLIMFVPEFQYCPSLSFWNLHIQTKIDTRKGRDCRETNPITGKFSAARVLKLVSSGSGKNMHLLSNWFPSLKGFSHQRLHVWSYWWAHQREREINNGITLFRWLVGSTLCIVRDSHPVQLGIESSVFVNSALSCLSILAKCQPWFIS